jgi:hypothetical protein
MDSLTGKWEGSYSYVSEGDSTVNVKFAFSLVDTNGNISGECFDAEEDGANPEPASINGFVKGNLISLIKQYPCYWYFNEDGFIEKILNKKHPEIHYSGRFINNKFIGTWEMEFESWTQGEGYISQTINGKWEMKKKK